MPQFLLISDTEAVNLDSIAHYALAADSVTLTLANGKTHIVDSRRGESLKQVLHNISITPKFLLDDQIKARAK